MLTPEQLNELAAIESMATAGPWIDHDATDTPDEPRWRVGKQDACEVCSSGGSHALRDCRESTPEFDIADCHGVLFYERDAAFIAVARNNFAALITQAREALVVPALREEIARQSGIIGHAQQQAKFLSMVIDEPDYPSRAVEEGIKKLTKTLYGESP